MERPKAQLIESIERSWASLDRLTGELTDAQLAVPGADGWSVKDHLAHLAAWNLSLVALLEGRDRDAQLGLTGGPTDVDSVNDLLHRRYAGLMVDEVRGLQVGSRQMVLGAMAQLSDADLSRPYNYFQPNDPGPDRDQPVLGWITGNTDEHADEHAGYIRDLIGTPTH
jgi:hypothetical protein